MEHNPRLTLQLILKARYFTQFVMNHPLSNEVTTHNADGTLSTTIVNQQTVDPRELTLQPTNPALRPRLTLADTEMDTLGAAPERSNPNTPTDENPESDDDQNVPSDSDKENREVPILDMVPDSQGSAMRINSEEQE